MNEFKLISKSLWRCGWAVWLLSGWSGLHAQAENRISYNRVFDKDTVIYRSMGRDSIRLVSATGQVRFSGETGYARIIVSTSTEEDFLVYEMYPLLADSDVVDFVDVHEETAFGDAVGPFQVKVEIEGAALALQDLTFDVSVARPSMLRAVREAARMEKINRLNANLQANNALWSAGETPVSSMSFEEKRRLFGGRVPDLQGAEYYTGGIFEIKSSDTATRQDIVTELSTGSTGLYVPSFDWRARHGAMKAGSPYYSEYRPWGWITPVKNQGQCGSCWVFGAIGAVEAAANLYFNRPLMLDLSEQEIVSCYKSTGCSGGFSYEALDYIQHNGVVNESCFPYEADNSSCSRKCTSPDERITIDGYSRFVESGDQVNKLKKLLIQAPVAGRISSWRHAITLIGYKELQAGDKFYTSSSNPVILQPGDSRIGRTAWLFKNSWGSSWGDRGFFYALVEDMSEMNNSVSLRMPVYSLNYSDGRDVVCEDRDGDGFYWWGIGPKPQTCPPGIMDEEDGDDSDPNQGPMDEYGYTEDITPISYTEITFPEQWFGKTYVNGDLIIQSGGHVTLHGTLIMPYNSKIEIREGGCMVIRGGVIKQGNIIVKSGACFTLQDGLITKSPGDCFEVEDGAELRLLTGSFEQKY